MFVSFLSGWGVDYVLCGWPESCVQECFQCLEIMCQCFHALFGCAIVMMHELGVVEWHHCQIHFTAHAILTFREFRQVGGVQLTSRKSHNSYTATRWSKDTFQRPCGTLWPRTMVRLIRHNPNQTVGSRQKITFMRRKVSSNESSLSLMHNGSQLEIHIIHTIDTIIWLINIILNLVWQNCAYTCRCSVLLSYKHETSYMISHTRCIVRYGASAEVPAGRLVVTAKRDAFCCKITLIPSQYDKGVPFTAQVCKMVMNAIQIPNKACMYLAVAFV